MVSFCLEPRKSTEIIVFRYNLPCISLNFILSKILLKATPLKYVREERDDSMAKQKLDFTHFDASPSPEKKPSPKIERVEPVESADVPQTPETPAERRKSRRRSSFFKQKMEEAQNEPDSLETTKTPEPKTPEKTNRTLLYSRTPENQSKLPKPQTPAAQTPSTPPRVRTIDSIRKATKAKAPETPGRRRSLIGTVPNFL